MLVTSPSRDKKLPQKAGSPVPPPPPGAGANTSGWQRFKARAGSAVAAARRRPVLSLIILVLLAGGTYWLTRGSAAPEATPRIVTVMRGNIDNSVTAVGNLQPRDYVDVGAQVSGQLKSIAVEIGNKVTKGQLLAEIDATVQSAKVQAGTASLAALRQQLADKQAQRALAQANADRQKRLMDENATSQADYDSAIAAGKSAAASAGALQEQIKQSEATLQGDKATLGYSKIYSPMDGTVVSMAAKVGQTLNASQQAPVILRVADLSVITVQTQVSEADVSKLNIGMPAYFTTLGSGNRRWRGTLRQILPTPTITNNVVLYTALFDVENNDAALLPQMTAQVFFVIASADDVVTVPVAALKFTGGQGRGNRGGNQQAAQQPAPNGQTEATMPQADAQAGQNRGQRQGGGFRGRRQGNAPGAAAVPRMAMVTVVKDNGDTEEREITIGKTDRVNAEVLAGLMEGEKVIAGMIQPVTANANDNNNNNRNRGGFGGGGFGRFR